MFNRLVGCFPAINEETQCHRPYLCVWREKTTPHEATFFFGEVECFYHQTRFGPNEPKISFKVVEADPIEMSTIAARSLIVNGKLLNSISFHGFV